MGIAKGDDVGKRTHSTSGRELTPMLLLVQACDCTSSTQLQSLRFQCRCSGREKVRRRSRKTCQLQLDGISKLCKEGNIGRAYGRYGIGVLSSALGWKG
jgi:hypothetical protein